MKTLASGWCPKHDRVYQRTDRCPECGTALVRLEPPIDPKAKREATLFEDPALARDGPPAPAAPPPVSATPRFGRFGAWPRRGGIALALLAAFGLGSMLPDSEPEPAATRPVTRDTRPRVQIARSLDGTTLRLDHVRQTGTLFDAFLVIQSGSLDPRQMEDAAVLVTTVSGGREDTYSPEEISIRPSPAGFVVAGTLRSDDPILEFRITSIQVLERVAPEWGVNLSSVWPVGMDEPRVLRLAGPAKRVEGGTVRLTALVCWRDRIEAAFALRDDEGRPGNRSELAGFEMRTSTPNTAGTLVGRALASTATELTSAGQLIVRFESIPENAGSVVILASRVLGFVEGPWTWRMP